jgi:hypothetical protein
MAVTDEGGDDEIAAVAVRECERVLRQNWHSGESGGRPFSYTRPSPSRYPWAQLR